MYPAPGLVDNDHDVTEVFNNNDRSGIGPALALIMKLYLLSL